MFKKMALLIFLLMTQMIYATPKDEVRSFVLSLSNDQKFLLDGFIRNHVKDSFMGFVLYGDKPICIEGYYLTPESGAISGIDGDTSYCNKGIELWQDLEVSVANKEYSFLIFDVDYGYRHLVCINRTAFLQAVNENLSLFRYVLGPTLTAEGLLKELITRKDQFYQVIKNDNVLLGILLGYGKQNSLLVSRKEDISDAFGVDRHEDFPFLSRAVRKSLVDLPRAQKKKPSLGFSTLSEEINAIKKRVVVTRELKPFKTSKIPYFGCEPQSQETKDLLDRYEKNRKEIIKAVEREDFLEETLLKLFTTTSKTVEVPLIPKNRTECLPKNKEDLVIKLIGIVHKEIRSEKHFCEDFITAFLEGAKASKTDEQIPETHKEYIARGWEYYLVKKELDPVENLEKADAYFKDLSSKKELTSLIPKRVNYEVLQKGVGVPVSSKVKHVSLHYSFHTEGGYQSDIGTVQEESLEHFIPGVARALIGMKRGEQRKLYIHPEYAYGEESYLPPNVVVVANIELVDFEEGDREAVFSQSHKSEKRDRKELLAKYQKLKREDFYANGVSFWDFMKKSGELIDFQEFEKRFVQGTKKEELFADDNERDQFINDLHWRVLLNKRSNLTKTAL